MINDELLLFNVYLGKAALKRPHSKRCARHDDSLKFAKRPGLRQPPGAFAARKSSGNLNPIPRV
jgi:hypothetical protein